MTEVGATASASKRNMACVNLLRNLSDIEQRPQYKASMLIPSPPPRHLPVT